MDSLRLTRRPLKTLGQVVMAEGMATALVYALERGIYWRESGGSWKRSEPTEEQLRAVTKAIAEMSIREPFKADRLTNRLRKMRDKCSMRRFFRAQYNRKERENYKKRIPQRADGRRRRPDDKSGPKRKAPDKRLGTRLRRR